MKAEILHPRSQELVEAELRSLDRIVAGVAPPPPDDPAAELQWRAWNNHRAELAAELDAARALEQRLTEGHVFKSKLLGMIERIREVLSAARHPSAVTPERVLPRKAEDDHSVR
jgi:hypothetical protein